MRDLTEENVTEAVLEKFASTPDPRLQAVMASFIKHLHGFIRDVEPTEEEWFQGITFLTELGQMCDDVRQENILWSDTLGVSILVDSINHRRPEGASQSTVLGPFYREGAPDFENCGDIGANTEGHSTRIRGRILDFEGNPVANACLDVWQTAPNGLYEVQDPEQPEYNLRGKFYSDDNGYYELLTVAPVSYSIPTDGPVGKMLNATGVHPLRPAHVHFIVTAEGYEPVVTQLFTEGDEYLDSDAVFGVKNSLVVEYQSSSDDEEFLVNYDFVLVRSAHRQ
ncbi:MAG: intradiol ring-cleavage dioxygenase [Gammaproteobacteria bacterium]|nr:intradiol ring-cleavage dioxygenase [Gammaproteobacteria bacterium]